MNKLMVFILMGLSIFLSGCVSKNIENKTTDLSTSSSSFESKHIELSEEYLIGQWQSTEPDWPVDLEFSKNSETKKLEIKFFTSEKEAQSFTADYGYRSFYNIDKSIEYRFSVEGNDLIMRKVYATDDPKALNAIRPWYLKKLVLTN